jgi:hypothetical protein
MPKDTWTIKERPYLGKDVKLCKTPTQDRETSVADYGTFDAAVQWITQNGKKDRAYRLYKNGTAVTTYVYSANMASRAYASTMMTEPARRWHQCNSY